MLSNQQIIMPTTPDPTLKESVLSTPPTIGAITAPANNTWPALSKMLDNLANCFLVSIGFLTRSQFFISVYDSLGFIGLSNEGESPASTAIRE